MKLLIGTSEGMFVLDGSDASEARGLAGRNVRQVARQNGSLFAAVDGGVFRAGGDGKAWEPSGLDGLSVWDLSAPRGQRALYASTQPPGLYRTEDGGRSWTEVETLRRIPGSERWCVPSSPLGARALTIAFDAESAKRLFVGIEVGGALLTEDGGATWTCSLPGGNPDIHVLVSHPARPGVLFATTGYGRINNNEPMEKRIAGLFGSEKGGKTWRYLWHGIRPQYTRAMCIDPRPPYALTVACAPSAFSSYKDPGGALAMLYQSEDDGETWGSLGDADHSPSAANFKSVTPDPEVTDGVLVGTDEGEVWRVSPAGQWTELANGLPLVQAIQPLAWRSL